MMTKKLMTIWGVMLALLVRAFRAVASACSAVRFTSVACIQGSVRAFVALALCMSAAPVYANDMDKESIAAEIRGMSANKSQYGCEICS